MHRFSESVPHIVLRSMNKAASRQVALSAAEV